MSREEWIIFEIIRWRRVRYFQLTDWPNFYRFLSGVRDAIRAHFDARVPPGHPSIDRAPLFCTCCSRPFCAQALACRNLRMENKEKNERFFLSFSLSFFFQYARIINNRFVEREKKRLQAFGSILYAFLRRTMLIFGNLFILAGSRMIEFVS